jgi:glucose dehydrogenase
VVAIDTATGKYKWHFQTVHHDIWDFDLPPAPGLIDIVRNGRKIPALAQIGKAALMYIIDRSTGKPVFGVEERPVPQTDVPGEQTSPTQPFPVKPPPLARVSFKPEDIVTEQDTTPEHANPSRPGRSHPALRYLVDASTVSSGKPSFGRDSIGGATSRRLFS